MKLYIDAKEPVTAKNTVLKEFDDRCDDIECEIKGVKTGDYVFEDVVIERKEGSDLVSSITDGRLKDQEARMVADFNHKYIIIEGDPYNQEHSNLHPNSIVGTQVSAAAKKNIFIVYTSSIEETAYAVYKIARTHADEEEFDPNDYALESTKVETEDTFVSMLTCVEGISAEKAKEISHRFDGVSDLCSWVTNNPTATKQRIISIDGVGEVLTERLISSFS